MNKQGFTLIELLVVIATIAVLSTILFPAFVKAHQKSQQSSCLANMKKLALANIMYLHDYDQTYMPANYAIDSNNNLRPNAGWVHEIYPYVKNYAIFKCPSANNGRSVGIAADYTYNYILGCDGSSPYYNNAWGRWLYTKPFTTSQVELPSDTALFWETYMTDGKSPNEDGYCGTVSDPTICIGFRPSLRHGKGSNVALVDGHAKFCSWPTEDNDTPIQDQAWFKLGGFWTWPTQERRNHWQPDGQYWDYNGKDPGV